MKSSTLKGYALLLCLLVFIVFVGLVSYQPVHHEQLTVIDKISIDGQDYIVVNSTPRFYGAGDISIYYDLQRNVTYDMSIQTWGVDALTGLRHDTIIDFVEVPA